MPSLSRPLAPYAVTELNTRGRQYSAEASHDRSPLQRDYTRILHSRAFRRLQGKTQVFSAAEGDLFRTRMSHSMEVEQLARTIAQQLRLNEDLCATLAIGHDIGHPPFGHTGQDQLDELMKGHGGFEHNHQALRLVDEIECAYTEHPGLNLLFETREGLLHCTPERARALGPVAAVHLNKTSFPLEVQVVDWADAIAYLHADLEDAHVRGILRAEDLREAPGFMKAWDQVKSKPRYASLTLPSNADFEAPTSAKDQRLARATVQTVLRQMMSTAVDNLVQNSRAQILQANPQSLDDVRALPPLVGFTADHFAMHRALKKFSRERIYEHPDVASVRAEQVKVLRQLFNAYVTDPTQMSGRGPEWADLPEVNAVGQVKRVDIYRAVADHLAGMTDAFALAEHRRLTLERPDLLAATLPKTEETPEPAVEVARRRSRLSR